MYQLPMKKDCKPKYHVYAIRISHDYREKINKLNEAGVDVTELIRPAMYDRIDHAINQVAKVR